MSDPNERFNLAPSAAELNMHETDVATIDAQIVAGLAANGGSAFGFLNNFFAKLPYASGRKVVEEAHMQHYLVKAKDTSEESQDFIFSELLFDMSYADFYDAIDDAVEAAGIDEGVLKDMQVNNNFSIEDLDAISEYALPVYRVLRSIGFSHADLWG